MKLTVTNSPFGLTIKFTPGIGLGSDKRIVDYPSISITSNEQLKPALGDHSERVPPVPIPNTVVKPLSPDGTACASVWESRTSPD